MSSNPISFYLLTIAAVSNFLAKKGYNQGAGSEVYLKAYRYFQYDRSKSAHRLKSEQLNPQGFPLINAPTHVWMFVGKK